MRDCFLVNETRQVFQVWGKYGCLRYNYLSSLRPPHHPRENESQIDITFRDICWIVRRLTPKVLLPMAYDQGRRLKYPDSSNIPTSILIFINILIITNFTTISILLIDALIISINILFNKFIISICHGAMAGFGG